MTKFIFSPDTFMDVLPNLISKVKDLKKGRKYSLQIKEHRNMRSLDANAYCWVLLDQLAVELSKDGPTVSPEDVYRSLIPHVGGNSEVLPVREDAIKEWTKTWGEGRTGWICEDMGPCRKLKGYHYVRCFYGSSVYDSKQMSRLIDLVVQECEQIGIETVPPAELERLKEEWT